MNEPDKDNHCNKMTNENTKFPDKVPVKEKQPEISPQLIAEPITLTILVQQLLRSPQNVFYSVQKGAKLPWGALILSTIVTFSIFGFILGLFSAGAQLWQVPIKVVMGIIFSVLLCTPSLFIFANLSGCKLGLKDVVSCLVCGVCVISLLLFGFVPVLWLFSNSSSSIAFFGFLALVVWIISLCIGLKFIHKSLVRADNNQSWPLTIWFTIFTLVTLQMPTTLRPIIGENEEQFLNLKEKKFFTEHWLDSIEPKGDDYPDRNNHQK